MSDTTFRSADASMSTHDRVTTNEEEKKDCAPIPVVPTSPVSDGYGHRVLNAPDVKPIWEAFQRVHHKNPKVPLRQFFKEFIDLRRTSELELHSNLQSITSANWKENLTLPPAVGRCNKSS